MCLGDTEPERSGRPASSGRLLALGAAGLCLALSGCRVIEANAWNLRQVHHADGTPSRRGDLRGPLEHVTAELLAKLTPAKDGSEAGARKRIEDPLGVCHRNLLELLEGDRDDLGELTLMVEYVTWLSGDCTYTLSRERCAIELGDLGRRFRARDPRMLPEDAEPADADAVRAALEPLLRVIAENPSDSALEAACERVRALTLNRDGVRRTLTVTNLILASERGDFAAVKRLHRELGRRALELSLGAALNDSDSRVRAAALTAWAKWSGGTSHEPVSIGFRDGHPDTVLAALRLLIKHGAPQPEELADTGPVATAEAFWMDRVVVLLTRLVDGPIQVAACRAMARLSGLPDDLHPEFWVHWWEDQLASFAPMAGAAPEVPADSTP